MTILEMLKQMEYGQRGILPDLKDSYARISSDGKYFEIYFKKEYLPRCRINLNDLCSNDWEIEG